MSDPIRILFLCTGNICRSPTAEGVFRDRVERAGLSERVQIDSAGTEGWHAGDPPDARSMATAAHSGYDLSRQRARQVTAADCAAFDLLIVMDRSHLTALDRLCGRGRARLLLDFAADGPGGDVPDPYYGAEGGFDRVLGMIESASDGLLAHVRTQHLDR
jgi:protein-tyrosine phosphatase